MTIDWTQPVETTEDPPRPVRVLCSDRPNPNRPIVVMRDDGQVFTIGLDGIGNPQGYPDGTYGRITLRNVAPPKPERVLREGWCTLKLPTDDEPVRFGAGVMSLPKAQYVVRNSHWNGVAKVSWMSDGSPVPSEASGEEPDIGAMSILQMEKQGLAEQRDHWKSKAEALQAEVEHMKPVVEAAVVIVQAHEARMATNAKFSTFCAVVRAYQQTPKKTAAEAVANVAKMMGPVKNCTTCAYRGLIEQYARCARCIDTDFVNWEPRHD